MDPVPSTYQEFWPYYVSQHLHPLNRALHFVGTTLALTCLALSLAVSPFWLPFSLVSGYGFAWVGHFAFERNRPATFRYPLWSLRGDFRMFRLTLLGQMGREIEHLRGHAPHTPIPT
jgi:hypothetical protein